MPFERYGGGELKLTYRLSNALCSSRVMRLVPKLDADFQRWFGKNATNVRRYVKNADVANFNRIAVHSNMTHPTGRGAEASIVPQHYSLT